jgi:hypothetical protein
VIHLHSDLKDPNLECDDYRTHLSYALSLVLTVFRWSGPPWVWVEKVVLSDLEVIPDFPTPYSSLARTNFFVSPQVPGSPLGVPVNSMPACRIRLEVSVAVPEHLPAGTPESERSPTDLHVS